MLDSRNAISTADGEANSPEVKQSIVGTSLNTVSTIKNLHIYADSHEENNERELPEDSASTWSYLHVHYKLADRFEQDFYRFDDAPVRCLVPKITYTRYIRKGKRIEEKTEERQAISGFVFYQGNPKDIQRFLEVHYSSLYLVKDSATNEPAVISDKEMQPFIQMIKYQPSLIRILDHPIGYYAQGHKLMRILTGILKGHEGYVIRKAGDRKFILPFGNKSLSISNIHKEQFEEV